MLFATVLKSPVGGFGVFADSADGKVYFENRVISPCFTVPIFVFLYKELNNDIF